MSSSRFLRVALTPCALLLCGVVALAAAPSLPQAHDAPPQANDAAPKANPAAANAANNDAARLDVYQKNDGSHYFALSLNPTVALPEAAAHDVAILFDTSASQASSYRDKALVALQTLAAGFNATDRVHLFAVDLDAVALTPGFVAATSPEFKQALKALQMRVPLGATDMPLALETAAKSFSEKSDRAPSLVYIGDGMSTANLMGAEEHRSVVNLLVARKLPLSSYAIGPRHGSQMLAALANQSGGMLAVDSDDVDAKQAGVYLLRAARGPVLWPTHATLPDAFAEVFPRTVPPLRADRETVIVGRAKGKLTGDIKVALAADIAGKSTQLHWTVQPGASNEDFAFLPTLLETAQTDDGVTLPTVGMAGLREAGRFVSAGADELTTLGAQAASTGNLDSAERLADEALRRDPNDAKALVIKRHLEKLRKTGKGDPALKAAINVKTTRHEQAAPPLTDALPPPSLNNLDDPGEASLLEQSAQQQQIMTSIIRTEVQEALKRARQLMASNPQGAAESLKTLLDRVRVAPELTSEARAQLRGQLEGALRETSRRASEKDVTDQARESIIAGAKERARIVEALARDQEKIKQLMDRFNSLMDEGRYLLAEEAAAAEVEEIAPNMPMAVSATLSARQTRYTREFMATRIARQKGVVDTLAQVEFSHIPFPDDQPIVYPDASVWEDLTRRRKKFASVDLKRQGGAEAKIRAALDESTTLEFVETPLTEVVDYLKDLHSIEIQIDAKALTDAGVGSDTPVTRNLKGISLRSALRLMLGAMDLTYYVDDEVLLITTPEKAGAKLVTKVYPVADLVLPIKQTGFSGGFGGLGGGMGGMGGMGGGGMGGMGGGMGGGGGRGGGMGGGFFAVPGVVTGKRDSLKKDLSLTPKKAVAPAAAPAVVAPVPAAAAKAPVAEPAAVRSAGKAAKKSGVIDLKLAPGADAEAAWNDYFVAHDDVPADAVRETVRHLVKTSKFEEAVALVNAALRNGQPQPWMYEAVALALQASGHPPADIERAVMSGLDFSDSIEDSMYVAQYMAGCGLEARALKIFRQVAKVDPSRPEPYAYGLKLSQRLNDLAGIQWATVGILSQAWPKDKRAIPAEAQRAALAAIERLRTENRSVEADDFQNQLDKALVRDCIVKVTWTGDADVDVLVVEPSGTICSFRNPRTASGGVMLGDAAAAEGAAPGQGASEVYVCPQGFSGAYRVILRRVWGKVTAGKVTVDVYEHYGTKQMLHEHQQVALGDQDSAVEFQLNDGRRKDALAQQQVANAANGQLQLNQAILAQQVNALSAANPLASANLQAARGGLFGGPFFRGAVGYQPVIITLPAGANMTATGVISADRRYVRVTVLPLFSQIGQVTTFNIASGSTQNTGTPGAGGGGVGGGGNGGGAGGGGAGNFGGRPGGGIGGIGG